MDSFADILTRGYTFTGRSIYIGASQSDQKNASDIPIRLPLSTLNRHGLISGATGTGKTKTIQGFLESLSKEGIPSIMMDMKGDVSGMAFPGSPHPKIDERLSHMSQLDWKPQGFPVEFWGLLWEGGSQLRATVSEFWPQLFARMLDLTEAQRWALVLVFSYCDDHSLLLVDLDDLKTVLNYLSGEWKKEIQDTYGSISTATVRVLIRKILELESQGARIFFWERSLDLSDMFRRNTHWKWQVNVVRLMKSIRYPKMFSTFMLSLLTEIYYSFPEVWDIEKPKGVIVIDEAHLLFRDISSRLLENITSILKLIRSKWVGVYFCTQTPTDIPESVLSQLGLKIQHALRAFTDKDYEMIRKMAKNFPRTNFYDVQKEMTTLGVWEALVTWLDESGRPTPLVRTLIAPPESRMESISDSELQTSIKRSHLLHKYENTLNPESAHEVLSKKIQAYQAKEQEIQQEKERKKNPTLGDTLFKTATKSIGTEMARSLGKKIGGRQAGSIGAKIARWILGSIFR